MVTVHYRHRNENCDHSPRVF